jgi:NAD(P)H-dependent flavin oxidoreductase YrpB (nitropropane dioxygenase family)
MLRTRFTKLVGVDHPVASAGMGGGTTGGELVGAVSEAGGLGVLGASFLPPDYTAELVRRARELTSKPIGINLLLHATEERVDEILALEPDVFSTAWPRDDQDLAAIFAKAHERGCHVMHMVPLEEDALRAVDAGADVVVAQGFEGGGHIGELASTVVVRQVVKAVAPVPVLAAGGFVDGAGLAAALALGADGVLLGTRFLATDEAPVPQAYKDAIVASDGTDTVMTTLSDSLSGRDWPGAWVRLRRTRFVEQWLGPRAGATPPQGAAVAAGRRLSGVQRRRRVDVDGPVGGLDRLGRAGRGCGATDRRGGRGDHRGARSVSSIVAHAP